MTEPPKDLNQIKEFQQSIHYTPKRTREIIKQIQTQEYLQKSNLDDIDNIGN